MAIGGNLLIVSAVQMSLVWFRKCLQDSRVAAALALVGVTAVNVQLHKISIYTTSATVENYKIVSFDVIEF